ncbi:Fc.00g033480.m01.CDS01 [Cosmosporella sp. VM-42]
MVSPLYKKALVLGATSGIGEAFAAKLIATGSKVIVVGRRQDRLDAFVAKHGADKATGVQFDVTDLAGIQSFAQSITQSHPDLDSVIINSGIQRAFNFSKPETLDLSVLGDELTTNYTSAVYLTAAFLPHLRTRTQGHLVYISASLALIPSLTRTPNYNASKSALHTFIIDVRQQLLDAEQSNVRMVEVFPPAVQTELHDEKHQPDMVNGGQIGMPLDQYTERMFQGLEKGEDQFAIGHAEDLLKEDGWESQRTRMFQVQQEAIRGALSPYIKKSD